MNELQRNTACKKQVGLKRAKIIRERQERWEGGNKREGGEVRRDSAKIKDIVTEKTKRSSWQRPSDWRQRCSSKLQWEYEPRGAQMTLVAQLKCCR